MGFSDAVIYFSHFQINFCGTYSFFVRAVTNCKSMFIKFQCFFKGIIIAAFNASHKISLGALVNDFKIIRKFFQSFFRFRNSFVILFFILKRIYSFRSFFYGIIPDFIAKQCIDRNFKKIRKFHYKRKFRNRSAAFPF